MGSFRDARKDQTNEKRRPQCRGTGILPIPPGSQHSPPKIQIVGQIGPSSGSDGIGLAETDCGTDSERGTTCRLEGSWSAVRRNGRTATATRVRPKHVETEPHGTNHSNAEPKKTLRCAHGRTATAEKQAMTHF